MPIHMTDDAEWHRRQMLAGSSSERIACVNSGKTPGRFRYSREIGLLTAR